MKSSIKEGNRDYLALLLYKSFDGRKASRPRIVSNLRTLSLQKSITIT